MICKTKRTRNDRRKVHGLTKKMTNNKKKITKTHMETKRTKEENRKSQ